MCYSLTYGSIKKILNQQYQKAGLVFVLMYQIHGVMYSQDVLLLVLRRSGCGVRQILLLGRGDQLTIAHMHLDTLRMLCSSS